MRYQPSGTCRRQPIGVVDFASLRREEEYEPDFSKTLASHNDQN
jgi:hypothetical protein